MPVWSREQARENGRKGGQSRWASARARASALAAASDIAPAGTESLAADSFTAELLAGVRMHVRRLIRAMEEELTKTRIDGAQVDRLASALERLAELERVLDGRPLPGSRRPPAEGRQANRPAAPPAARPRSPMPTPARPVQRIMPQPLSPEVPIGVDEDDEDPPLEYSPEPF